LYELVEKDKRNTISEVLIRSLNRIVMRDIDKEWAGKYRNSSVLIGGADHKPPEAIDVPEMMRKLVAWFNVNRKKLHQVELASILHHKLVSIHPFFDGNGRTSRLMMNVVLMQAGFPLVTILKNDRKRYYRTLSEADKGNYGPFINFIAQAVERTVDIYLRVLTPQQITKERFILLSKLAKKTSFTEKYLNLLARAGKLSAHKEGRNWLSSEEALKNYLRNRDRKRKG
jgi:Fic family protein